MKSIPAEKLRELAKYLDQCPYELSENQDEYWRLLIKSLPRRLYTRAQIERFADEYQKTSGSPSLLLLYDLREKGVKLELFKQCLEKIRCVKALNLFLHGTIPEFTRHPQPTTIPIRGRLVLTCSAHCDPPPPEYLWYKNNFPLVSEKSEVLEIECVNPSHSGIYQCVALNPRMNDSKVNYVVSNQAKVEVIHYSIQESDHVSQVTEETTTTTTTSSSSTGSPERPRSNTGLLTQRSGLPEPDIVITEQPKDLQCRFRETFTLTCQATSRSRKPLSFTWIRKKQGRSETVVIGSGLALKFCSNRCEELMICCRVSVAGSSSEGMVESNTVTVTVISIWFTEQPRPVNGFIGHQAMIKCSASGKEPISYIWFKSKTPDGRKELVSGRQESDCGILHFESLQHTDWGYYTCQAENEDKFISSSSVYVQCEPEIIEGPEITITSQPGSIVCQLDDSVTLICEATCSVPFSYCWYHNDMVMYPVENQSSIGIHVDESAFGSYCCHITIDNGYHKEKRSRVAQLVLGKPAERPENMKGQQIDQWKAELALATATGLHFAHDKLALLIGNQNYGHGMNRLSSAISDVILLKTELESLDFKVFSFSDLTFVEMMRVFEEFCNLIHTWGMYVVFYYSGHGFDHHNVEYLMPVDATIPIECDQCISADYVTLHLQKTLSKVFVFLDCCRTTYDSAEKVKGPHKTSSEACAYANIFKTLSCSRNQPAYEKRKEPCSVFNRVLRSFLSDQRSTNDLDSFLLQGMQQEGQSKGGRAFQRPDTHVKMLPVKLSLHDPIMWETWNETAEEFRVKGHDAYIQSTIVPAPVNLTARDFDALIEGKVLFERELANVIILKAEFTKHLRCDKSFMTVDRNSLQGAGIEGGEVCDSFDKKAVKQEFRIVGLQKTKEPELRICFTVSAISTSGLRKDCKYTCNTRVAIIGKGKPSTL